MRSSQLNTSRFIVGLVLVIIAVGLFVLGEGSSSTVGEKGDCWD